MKYLIDTHILIWLAVSPEKISKSVLSILENPRNEIFFSTVSLWEISIKLSIGKLDLEGLEISDLANFCGEQNIKFVQLPISATEQYRKLPKKEKHKDPFDRLLISLCIADGYIFLTSDGKANLYNDDGLTFID